MLSPQKPRRTICGYPPRLFGYAELLLVRQHVGHFEASFLQPRSDRCGRHLEVHLHGTGNWKILMDAVAELVCQRHHIPELIRVIRQDIGMHARNRAAAEGAAALPGS